MAMMWRGTLPQPVLDGTKATYPEVFPGVDLVVEATRSGFEQLLVVKSREGVASVRSVRLGLKLAGRNASPETEGGLLFKNSSGRVVGRTPTPLMWDSARDPVTQEPDPKIRKVDLGLGAKPRAIGDEQDVTLSPDAAWLDDPARQFPITIDPYVVPVQAGFDTYVQSNVSYDLSSSTELRIGSQNSGVTQTRSFVNLSASGLNGSRINWATLKLWQSGGNCSAAGWELWRTASNATAATRWSNMPALAAYISTSTQSACGGWVEIEAKDLYQYAADNNWGEFSAGLKAYWEDTNSFYKVFRSKESGTTPHVSLNWNEPPALSGLSTNPATSGCVTGASRPWITSKTPRLSANVSDSDGAASDMTFEVANTGNPTPIATYQANGVASGTVGSVDVAAGVLQEDQPYSWRVQAKDPAGTPVGQWSSWCEFTVDSRKPGVPWVSSTEFPENGRATVGTGTFTFTQASTAQDGQPENSVMGSYTYQLDGQTSPTTLTADASGNASVNLSNLADGNRSLTVTAKDKAGNPSNPKVYNFAVGRAGISEPIAGAAVQKSVKIALEIPDTTLTRASFKYRRGPGGAEYSIPLANLRKADLSPVSTDPLVWSQAGGYVVWDALDTLGSLGGVVEIRADMFPTADGQPAYATAWVKVTVDPNGDGAASTSVGSGQLNLLTGDHTLSATDIDEFGLSVSRTASSREPADGWMAQGQRLTTAQQQVTDITGFSTVACAQPGLYRSIGGGQGGSVDALAIRVENCGSDSYAVIGGTEAFKQGMKPGRKYKATAWIYVPASVGLNSGWYGWGQMVMGIANTPGGTQRFYSEKARYVDAWQEITLVMDVPSDATDASFVLWNAGNVGATVYFDNISVTELIAPFGPQWRGGVIDPVSASEYLSITIPDNDSAAVNLAAGGQVWFGRSSAGDYFPAPGAETLSLKKVGTNFELSELDGTVTEFIRQSDTKYLINRSWNTAIGGGAGSGTATGTRFIYDSGDYRTLVKKVISPTEAGVESSSAKCTDDVPVKGCEVLEYEYATLTTARGFDPAKPWEFGDVRDQVRAVKIWSWDPAVSAVTSVEVARYLYDSKGQLRHVFDPRTGPANTNLALNKTATSSAPCGASEGPEKAVNGTVSGANSDKWCSLTAPRWLQVDLGSSKTINSFTVDHAQAGGEAASMNTKDFDIQVSTDGTNWTTVVAAVGNTEETTSHWIAGTTARYVKLNVTTPTQNGDAAARIYELKALGHDGVSLRLSTVYDYDTAGRVTAVTPAGQLPWMFDYGTIGNDPNAGWLHRIRRASLVQGSKTQTGPENSTRIVYKVPATRGAGGPHDMALSNVSTWAQTDVPTDATAIFGPEDDPLTTTASATVPGADGYKYATVHYLNANAQQINTATPAAAAVSAGNIDSQQYDRFGNVVWSLEATNRLIALGQHPQTDLLGQLGLSPLSTKDRADQLATVSVYSADGKDLVSKTGPAVKAVLETAHGSYAAGASVTGRTRTEYTYDEGKPDGADYHLVTTEKTGLQEGTVPGLADERVTKTGYAPINGSHSGWILRQPTQVTSDAGTGGANLNAYTVYDSAGKTLKSWGVGQSATQGAKQTIYYTAGANSDDAACGNKPEWAGQACVTKTVGESLPVRRVGSYNRYGDAAIVSESNAGKTRTSTTTFDIVGRVSTVALTSDDGTTPIATTTTVYDTASGQPIQITAGTASTLREYDLLGRTVKYTDADNGVTTSEYDRYGRPAKTIDPTGTVTYGYDRAAEPRGMLTTLTDSTAGTFTAGYSPDGQLTTVGYPGGITRTDTLDANMQPYAREYKRDSDGFKLYTETIEENAHGQWASHTYNGGFKTFTYDRLGRLTKAVHEYNGQCTTRAYEFVGVEGDRTNRTAKKTWQPGQGGQCDQTGTADETVSYTYSSVDRLLSDSAGSYTYDEFGRTATLPGGLVNTFHANDMVASQTLGDNRQTWTLDPAMRLRTFTAETRTGGVWGGALTKVNHFDGDSDSPKWITENTANGNWTRMVEGPEGDFAISVTQAGVKTLNAVSLHGDVVFTLNLATPGGMPDAFYDYDEYGNPTVGSAGRYGWLGGKQRSAETLGGVVLMGVRLYSASLGRFLSVDPVDGGSCHAYDYVCADPVNEFDLDGRSLWSKIKKAAAVVAPIASFAAMIPGPIGTAAALISAGAYAISGNYKMAAIMAGTAALAMVGAGAAGVAAGLAIRGAGRAASVTFKTSQLQKKFKHAKDFNVMGTFNKINASKFAGAMRGHVGKITTIQRTGFYRRGGNMPVNHYVSLNPFSRRNVITTRSGEFHSAWKMSFGQWKHVIRRGIL